MGATAAIEHALSEGAETTGLVEIGSEIVEALRIEGGSPRFGIDYGPENLPQETGLEDAVSYTKGCYLGQEVVARLHYRGQVARCLRQLRAPAGDVPPSGSLLSLDDREAGVVTSATRSPSGEEIWAIAMLQRRALEKDTRLHRKSGQEFCVV